MFNNLVNNYIITILEKTKVTQNNTDMYTKESSQRTFKILNNKLDVRFERAYQNYKNEMQTRMKNKISHNL